MKISRANTDMLKRALALNSKLVAKTDKNLYDRMKYTSDAIKKGSKVTRTDLMDLLNDVKTVLGKNFIDPVMAEEMKKTETPVETPAPAPKKESSLKKTKKEAPSTSALKEASKKLEKQEEPKKASAPKATEKVTPVEPVSVKERPLAKYFPKTIEVEGETYECARKVTSMKDVRDLLNEGKGDDLIFAFYWNKRHLKQFEYFDGIIKQPKEFKDDLDLCGIVYVSDSDVVMYVVSMYTEAVYTVYPFEIPEEKEGLRFSAGLEYQIYLKTETKKEAPVEDKKVAEEPAPAPKKVEKPAVEKKETPVEKTATPKKGAPKKAVAKKTAKVTKKA